MTLERDIIIKSVYFDTLDEFRLVNPITTAYIVLSIKKWADANLDYPFDINSIIPENIGKDDNLNRYSEYYVNSSYALLKHNLVLTFNEALFILLGLYPYNSALPPFHDLNLINYDPFSHGLSLGSVFFITRHFEVLKRSPFLRHDGRILSEDLIELAKLEGFFNEVALQALNTNEIDNDKRKESTKKTQQLITKIAKKIIKEYPEIQKQTLAFDINTILKEKHKINHLKDSAIARQYLNNYKSLKGNA
jgi:hypothetical protein